MFNLISLINRCLGMFHLGFILFGTLWLSWTWVPISFSILGKFSTIISSRIFSWSFFLSSSSGTSHQSECLRSKNLQAINNTQRDRHKDNSWSFNRNSSGQKGKGGHTYSADREKPTSQITITSKDLIQIWRKNQKLYRQAKAKGIQHHKTSFSTNAKKNLSKQETQKRPLKTSPKE